MRRRFASFAALLFVAPAAWAAAVPLLLPRTDVTILYQVSGRADNGVTLPDQVRAAIGAGGMLIRLDAVRLGTAVVLDRVKGHAFLVNRLLGTVVILPPDHTIDRALLAFRRADPVRRGEEVIAGLPCTVWAVNGPRLFGTACITADGMILSAKGRETGLGEGSIQALSVRYGKLPSGLFSQPVGFWGLDARLVPP